MAGNRPTLPTKDPQGLAPRETGAYLRGVNYTDAIRQVPRVKLAYLPESFRDSASDTYRMYRSSGLLSLRCRLLQVAVIFMGAFGLGLLTARGMSEAFLTVTALPCLVALEHLVVALGLARPRPVADAGMLARSRALLPTPLVWLSLALRLATSVPLPPSFPRLRPHRDPRSVPRHEAVASLLAAPRPGPALTWASRPQVLPQAA